MKLENDLQKYMWEWLKEYINHNCIERVAPDLPPLPGKKEGTFYRWQFYLRKGLFNHKFLSHIGYLFWNKFADKYHEQPFQIAGLETGSTPLIVGLTMTAPAFDINVNSFSIRAQRKAYGLKNIFEGIVDSDLPVLIVDDLSNSKDTIMRARQECTNENLTLLNEVFTVVHKDSIPNFNSTVYNEVIENNITYHSLFNLNNFELSYNKYMLMHAPLMEVDEQLILPEEDLNIDVEVQSK